MPAVDSFYYFIQLASIGCDKTHDDLRIESSEQNELESPPCRSDSDRVDVPFTPDVSNPM